MSRDYMIAQASFPEVFKALSHRVRCEIAVRLSNRVAMRLTDLAAGFDMSLNAVDKHLRAMEAAGLVIRTKHGREVQITLNSSAMRMAARWLLNCSRRAGLRSKGG